MAQQTINVGSSPNDGQGDPIRDAFIKCNSNFGELYSRTQVSPPPTLVGSVGDQAGMYAYDSSYFYYCFANYDGSSIIWGELAPIGNISATQIVNGTSSFKIQNPNGNANVSVAGVSNVAVFTANGVTISGNVSLTGQISAAGNITGGYIIGDGSLLTGIPATYGNAQAADFLANFGSNSISTTGNITGGYFIGDGSLLTGVTNYGNTNVAAYLTTYSGNLTANVVSATGNITGNYILGNGSQLTGLPEVYGNSNVAAYLPTYTGNVAAGNVLVSGAVSATGALKTQGTISATGNIITAGYFVGNFAGNISGCITVPGSNTQVLFNTNGNADAAGGLTFDTNGPNLLTVLGNIQSGNVLVSGLISAAGNVKGNYFIGDGSLLTGITTVSTSISNGNSNVAVGSLNGNVTVSVNNTANVAVFNSAGMIVAANIETGNLSATTSITATGNIAGGNVLTGGLVSATGNIIGGNLRTGGLISATGNVSANNVNTNAITASTISASGNVTVGNLSATNITGTLTTAAQPNITSVGTLTSLNSGTISSSGNVTGANLVTGGQVFASGNITASYFIGNGSQLTGGYGNTNVQAYLPTYTGNLSPGNVTATGIFSATGNITGGNVISAGIVSAAGNVIGQNLLTTGAISASGNIAGNTITATTVNSTTVSASGNIAGGTINATNFTGTALSLSGNITGDTINGTNFLGSTVSASGNITGGNLTTAGVLTVNSGNAATAIVNGGGNATGNIGSSTKYFNTVYATATTALYADLAECYTADADYEPGTVLCFAGTEEVTQCNTDMCVTVAGVVSTRPAYQMNSGLSSQHVATVALLGRVPCRVQGPVTRGALMVSAGNGHARAESNPVMGSVIGKALEAFDGDVGTIEIVVGRL